MLKARSRRRLMVVQVMILSLFATLFTRLWYLQVIGGESYQAAAQENTVRDIEVAAPRGLIVDSMGRPLVANRTSWVVTVDRFVLDRLGDTTGAAVLRRLARTLGLSSEQLDRRLKLCGEVGAARSPICWNGSPYAPVPVAEDVSQSLAASILEQSEDFPGITAEARKVRAYPAPYGINAAHVLGYNSPITDAELDTAKGRADSTVSPLSVVGRAGLEKEYDRWLRGTPGDRQVTVDSMGRVLGDGENLRAQAGNTLVTTIDAKVQGVVERQLNQTIQTARKTVDPVTDRRYAADSGAAVVLDARTGRVVAMASQPTYDPNVWTGGITQGDLERLYSERAGTPLLSRAFQGQFAPGSTFKPFMAAGALTHGYSPATRLDCSSSFRVGNRDFKNYESGAYGPIDFAKALQVSCNTFFYRIGYGLWVKTGAETTDVDTPDPLVDMAESFGFGEVTGIDLPSEMSGRIADRKWKLAYWRAQKDYYCSLGKEPGDDFVHRFAREFCVEGYTYTAADAVNFSIGQGDTIVTPLQLATAYAALGNGGTLWEPRVAKAIVSPEGEVIRRIEPNKASQVPVPQRLLRYLDTALMGTTQTGTSSWRFIDFPLDRVKIRSKTGSAEVYGKQSTSWLASYNRRYVVVMMVEQGGTGSGTSGPAIRKIWEALYGIKGEQVRLDRAAQPGATPPAGLPVFHPNGQISAPESSAAARQDDGRLGRGGRTAGRRSSERRRTTPW
ncbi:MAG: Peptidoglycan D,D-transpeptidase MrdA [uncultured Nocardioidaceae bacterium]|uniref:Peptidoglycan D,D-transpeptidase MrdA n=1 Tax=uncultured Nocardioidaceae bacterium TaxID=253824 RepID=A0A6J4N011_9ACTN|nr:MAG: Peptidoglycan D,D-transpeptidase MrdA [uncultured Nocardioidaceae bacterium]